MWEVKWTTASLTKNPQKVKAENVNSGRRRREVNVVRTEENGNPKTYRTYRDLDTEYNKKEEKSRHTIKETNSKIKVATVTFF